uniref:DUF4781 domain-containing protein n=1 Tax=Panagrellus redivivus TaxID=6233 RepID=A0A7E4UY82_PANRE
MATDSDAISIVDSHGNDVLTAFEITAPTTPEEPLNDSTWFAHARKLQYYFYQSYSPNDYDRYNISNVPMLDELQVLKTKICFLRYGQPKFDDERETLFELEPSEETKQLIENSPNSDFNCPFDYYTVEQRREAEKLAEIVVKQKNEHEDFVDVCILFLCYWKPLEDSKKKKKKDDKEDTDEVPEVLPVPLFRIGRSAKSEKDSETVTFVDFEGRVYPSWERYLKYNRLPAGAYCCPHDGFYSMREASDADEKFADPADALRLDHGFTPASHSLYKFIEIGDKLSIVSSVGSLAVTGGAIGIGLATSITVAPIVFTGTAIAGGITALYSAVRGAGRLADRGIHKQSISIMETEARSAWITIASTAAAGASLGATTLLASSAANASDISNSAILTTNFFNGTNIAVSFAGLINNGHLVIMEYISKDKKPSTFEIMNLTLSVLLFTHSVVNFKTANTIIEEASSARVSQIEQSLDTKKSQKGYERILQNLDEPNIVTRNKRIIRTVKNVDNTRDFFRRVYDLTKVNNREGHNQKITFGDNGGIIIGGKEFSANSINQLTKGEQNAFLNALSSSGAVDLTETDAVKHLEELKNVTTTNEKAVQKAQKEDIQAKVFTEKNIKAVSSVLFAHLPKIAKLLENVKDPKNVELIILIAKDISNRLGFKNLNSFLEVVLRVRIWFMNQANNKVKPKKATAFTENPVTKDVIYLAFHEFHHDDKYAYKFESPEMAMENYLTHFPLTSNNVMSVNDFWQTVQNVFQDATHQMEVCNTSVRIVETEHWFGKCLFQETDKMRGVILSFKPK